jgi:hypothetical protein
MLRLSMLAVTASLALATVAQGQEVVQSNDAHRADPPAATAPTPEDEYNAAANGAWARAVMDNATNGKAAAVDGKSSSGCVRNPDRAPHGEVWAGAGTGGYRDYGGVVTRPLGDCAQVTLGIEQSQDNYGGGYGRRGR